MSLPTSTDDGCSGRGGGYTGGRRLRSASGPRYPNHGGHIGSTRSSSQHRFGGHSVGSFRGGSFDPSNDGENSKRARVGTYTSFGMGGGGHGAGRGSGHGAGRGVGCCQKGNNNTGSGNAKNGAGCATPENCRCVNLDDPQKVFKLVLQAIRHINDGEGATPVEIHCYMRKHHRMPDDEDKLMQIVKDSLKRGICIGCLRRRYCDGKYYISEKSSGRVKRKPGQCMTKETAAGKKSTLKSTAAHKKGKKGPLTKPKKKIELHKTKSRARPKKGGLKKPKTKKKATRIRIRPKPKARGPPKKNKRKGASTSKAKRKGKFKSGKPKPKPKPKCPKTPDLPADGPKKNKCSLFPRIWPNFELRAGNRVDHIWDNIPPSKW